MSVTTDSFVTFSILWGIPTALVLRGYLKMNDEERKSAQQDFKSKGFIMTMGFMLIGAFLSHVGMVFNVLIIKGIGMTLFTLGGIISAVDMWKVSKVRSVFLIFLTTVVICAWLM